MKKIALVLLASLFLLSACNQKKTVTESDLKTQIDTASYLLAYDIAKNMKNQQLEINNEVLASALENALSGNESMFDEQVTREIMQKYFMEMNKKKQEADKKVGEANLEEGKKFLEANKKEDGVVETESGLQYKVLKEGTGKKPTDKDKVTVHYEGKTIDGTVFDSSYERNQPATFPVTGVIKGWTEALQLMKEGAKYKLYVPSDLAYGPQRRSAEIGPNQLLIFEVELIKVN